MAKMTREQKVTALRGMVDLLVDQRFGGVTDAIAPGVRALASTQPPDLRAILVAGMFDAILAKLEEAKVALVAEFSVPAELGDADRSGAPA